MENIKENKEIDKNEIYLTIKTGDDKSGFSEYWTPTFNLRWIKKEVPFDNSSIMIIPVLQQMWQGSLGNIEWKDIEVVENS